MGFRMSALWLSTAAKVSIPEHMINMDFLQNSAFQTAQLGHNVVILGQAGSGKTYVVKEIWRDLSGRLGKRCAVTCTTGIACKQYGEMYSAQTIHR